MANTQTRKRRQAADLVNLPRSAALSHLYRAAEAVAPPNYPPVSMFSPSALFEWAKHYLKYVFHRKHPFPSYKAVPGYSMFDLGGDDGSPARVSLAGDWGTGTEEAEQVALQMQSVGGAKPDFTIHLGDVYYVGDPVEVRENCLNRPNPANNYVPVEWKHGTIGSFAMNGNHEMYANGNGYFDVLLPTLGLAKPGGGVSGQHTSFFCLQNRYWRIIAIDTGYNSIGLPVLSQIPLIQDIPGVGGNCKLPKLHMDWLKQVVRADADTDKRGLVILSHHQYYSGFEGRYTKPARQLWQAGIRRQVLWFWGHEHRLAGYDPGGKPLRAFGRCVGHGGMPIELKDPNRAPEPLFYDHRQSPNSFGFNGCVNLIFSGPKLDAAYVDLNGQTLLTENWEIDADGQVVLGDIKKITQDPDFIYTGTSQSSAAAAAAASGSRSHP